MTFIEVGILVLIALPVLRAATHPSLRRAFAKTAAAMTFAVVAGIVSAALIGFWFPALLHALTALAVLAAMYALWHARPGYGRSRRLPPGSLSLVPFGYLTDPFFFQKRIERYGVPFKTNQFGNGAGPNPFRGAWQPVCCVDLQLGIKILGAYDERLIPPPIPASRFIPKKYMREMKHDDHRRYWALFSSAFDSSVVDESAAFVTQHVRSSLRQMADESSSNGHRGIVPEPYIFKMTFGVFARCFFGVFPDDESFDRLHELANIIDMTNRNSTEVTRALDEFARIALHSAATRSNNAPRSFLGEIARLEPGALEDLTVIRNIVFIMQASWIDTSGLMDWIFKELSDHPEWTERIARDGGQKNDGTESLSRRCVKETLRLRQSEYLYRKILADIPMDGFVIPKGWLLRVCIRESHRDSRIFENPNTFNPDRFLAGGYPRSQYSTFGASRISCLGEHLTLTLGQIFVEGFAATIATSVLQDGPLEYRRWHWKPSSKWRVRVQTR